MFTDFRLSSKLHSKQWTASVLWPHPSAHVFSYDCSVLSQVTVQLCSLVSHSLQFLFILQRSHGTDLTGADMSPASDLELSYWADVTGYPLTLFAKGTLSFQTKRDQRFQPCDFKAPLGTGEFHPTDILNQFPWF